MRDGQAQGQPRWPVPSLAWALAHPGQVGFGQTWTDSAGDWSWCACLGLYPKVKNQHLAEWRAMRTDGCTGQGLGSARSTTGNSCPMTLQERRTPRANCGLSRAGPEWPGDTARGFSLDPAVLGGESRDRHGGTPGPVACSMRRPARETGAAYTAISTRECHVQSLFAAYFRAYPLTYQHGVVATPRPTRTRL